MGYIRHHAIIVTSFQHSLTHQAHKRALAIFSTEQVSEILPEAINGYTTFLIGPDGSKEGWEDSNIGDRARDRFIKYLEALRENDGSSCIDWVEVRYGDDNWETKIIRHNHEGMLK